MSETDVKQEFLPCDVGAEERKKRRKERKTVPEPVTVDFIGKLPIEVSHIILRQLDDDSLLCAAQVSRKWLEVCKADKVLRERARIFTSLILRLVSARRELGKKTRKEMEMVRKEGMKRPRIPG